MPIIIILFIVAVFIIIKFYRSHKHLIKFVIKALVGLYIWLILGAGLDKYDDNSSLLLWVIFYIIAASVVPNLGNRFSHKIDDADTPKEYRNLIIS